MSADLASRMAWSFLAAANEFIGGLHSLDVQGRTRHRHSFATSIACTHMFFSGNI